MPPSEWFWELLESSNRSLVQLCRKLESLPAGDVERYGLEFDEAKEDVSTYRDECHPYLVMDETMYLSEDGDDDFTVWVVMQGRHFYELVRSHPEQVLTFIGAHLDGSPEHPDWDCRVDREEYRGWQSADGVAAAIYLARFGKRLRDVLYDERGWPRPRA